MVKSRSRVAVNKNHICGMATPVTCSVFRQLMKLRMGQTSFSEHSNSLAREHSEVVGGNSGGLLCGQLVPRIFDFSSSRPELRFVGDAWNYGEFLDVLPLLFSSEPARINLNEAKTMRWYWYLFIQIYTTFLLQWRVISATSSWLSGRERDPKSSVE